MCNILRIFISLIVSVEIAFSGLFSGVIVKGVVFVWRSRRDLNSRAGYPTYALSRGASSPT